MGRARYQTGDVLNYIPRQQRAVFGVNCSFRAGISIVADQSCIERGSYAQVVTTDANKNFLTVRKENEEQVTYDPARLLRISAYRALEREFAVGDRLSFTAPNRDLGVANRDLGTI